MMWETKHKHKGVYKKPTGPLAKDSKMNAPAVFELPKVQKPSAFLKSHFPEVKKGRKSRSEADEFIKKYRAEGMTSRQISKKLKEAHGITMNQSTIFKKFKSLEGSGDCDLRGGITILDVYKNKALLDKLKAQHAVHLAKPKGPGKEPEMSFAEYVDYYVKATNEHEADEAKKAKDKVDTERARIISMIMSRNSLSYSDAEKVYEAHKAGHRNPFSVVGRGKYEDAMEDIEKRFQKEKKTGVYPDAPRDWVHSVWSWKHGDADYHERVSKMGLKPLSEKAEWKKSGLSWEDWKKGVKEKRAELRKYEKEHK